MAARTASAKDTRSPQDRGMVRRLTDQLAVQEKAQQRIEAIHENARKLTERAFYPAHDARKETAAYVKVHKHLTEELDLPCLVCGVKKSTLGDGKENPYGARAMETHHHLIEWSLANAIDTAKFNKIILPHLKARYAQKPDYRKAAFTDQDVRDWVDHSADNLWVLCDVHHRAPYLGIHEITYPIWCPMDLLRDDFADYVRQQVQRQKKAPAGKKKAAKGVRKKKR